MTYKIAMHFNLDGDPLIYEIRAYVEEQPGNCGSHIIHYVVIYDGMRTLSSTELRDKRFTGLLHYFLKEYEVMGGSRSNYILTDVDRGRIFSLLSSSEKDHTLMKFNNYNNRNKNYLYMITSVDARKGAKTFKGSKTHIAIEI